MSERASPLLAAAAAALAAAERYRDAAKARAKALVAPAGRVEAELLDRHQFAAHGMAWIAAYVEGLRRLLDWAERLDPPGVRERAILEIGFGEYLAQLCGGIAMSQGEIARPADLGLADEARALADDPAARAAIARGTSAEARAALAALLDIGAHGDSGYDDETAPMADAFRRFAAERVAPIAARLHDDDALIPLDLIAELARLGVFGLTVGQEFGGAGLGKTAMCAVTEALSQASLAVGSLATRAEIAGALIADAGTPAQKARWLPGIADGTCLPTAVFTEPDAGSDLGAIKTRAVRDGAVYRVTGAKTWATHAARADLMTILVRTDPATPGPGGLSLLLAEKPRGSVAAPLPARCMSGSEIRVLGYRGMKEYEIAFDGFAVPAEALLGGVEGRGFRQLMATFEAARIQTAARAVGVADAALGLALAYARQRRQFGRPIAEFPRVAGKLAAMAVEIAIARQLTLYAAREKDRGRRADVPAGMAKLLAARAAWAAADNAVQIHGGNGYAVEFPASRLLLDARILNIFEGAAEIQAQVIARGLLSERN